MNRFCRYLKLGLPFVVKKIIKINYLCAQIQKFMIQRYFIRFAYDGTNYHGWQLQPNAVSVQEVMTEIMQHLFGPHFMLTAAGRTDAGVHARMMYAHFDTEKKIIDVEILAKKLDLMMPSDIKIFEVIPVRPDAHARFDATSRTYEYWMADEKDPFNISFYTRMYGNLDYEAMNRAAKCLFDYTDFTSFSKAHTDVKTNNCKIMQAYWEKRGIYWVFTIQADRFLRNMVRAVVGTLFEVGRGKMDEAGFRAVIESENRSNAGTSVHAQGLFLTEVSYPEELFQR
ncbi:MAG: tRNA pseudouridine(38-40) synthase TruA [Bacteroidales bacterium]|nr:tRNA pseudouridine(38-40) synthase TruA [Bacteroidales bacterium]